MEPRARVSGWPGRRRVPGIVAPDSWGARGAECLPRDVLRRSSPATSPCDGTTARRCLCHGTGSGTTEARPPASSVPPAPHGGLGGLSRHPANSGPDFRSSSYNCRLVIRTDTDFPDTDFPTPISRHRFPDTDFPTPISRHRFPRHRFPHLWALTGLLAAGILVQVVEEGIHLGAVRFATGIFTLPEAIALARPCESELLVGHGVGPDIAGRSR